MPAIDPFNPEVLMAINFKRRDGWRGLWVGSAMCRSPFRFASEMDIVRTLIVVRHLGWARSLTTYCTHTHKRAS